MTATTDDADLARLDDDGCPHAPDAGDGGPDWGEWAAGGGRRLALAALAVVVSGTGCRVFRDDHPSARYEPPVVAGYQAN